MHPTDPSVMTVRYKYGGGGALVTRDGGKTWKLLCNSLLFDPVTTQSGAIAVAGDGTMLVAGLPGMWHDDGHACSWSSVPQFDTEYVGGFAVDPLDATITYAVTSSGGQLNGIVRRDKTGNWSDLGTKKNMIITDMLVVPHGSGRRFYLGTSESLITDGGPMTNYGVRVSDDDGATWTDHTYGAADGLWNLQGVDPSNPDRLIASIERPEDLPPPAATTDTVLVSTDRGATFEEYLTVTEIGAVAFASDGRVWIGDAGALDPKQPQGVWYAKSLAVPATKLPRSNYPVQCLEYRDSTDTLYACQHSTFGTVDTASGAFTTELDLRTVGGFVECPGIDTAATCETQVCLAYCGFGHFSRAPVCCAYSSPTCGPLTSNASVCPVSGTGGAGVDASVDASAGGARYAGSGVDASGTGGSGGGSGDGNTEAGTPGGAGRGDRGTQGGGCCSVVGRTRSGADSMGASALIGTLLTMRRLRRNARKAKTPRSTTPSRVPA